MPQGGFAKNLIGSLFGQAIESKLKYSERIKSREYLKRTGKISVAIKKLR